MLLPLTQLSSLFFTLAVVKVLQLLPAAAMRFQLPRTLQKVANLLRVRLQSIRCVAPHAGCQPAGLLHGPGCSHILVCRLRKRIMCPC